MNNYICIDIETVPGETRSKAFDIKPPQPKQNFDTTMGMWQTDNYISPEEYEQHRIKTMSVTPEYLQIFGLGWQIKGKEPGSAYVGEAIFADGLATGMKITEKMLLKKFWQLYTKAKGAIAGYNIVKFDVPALVTRSVILGVEPSPYWKPDAKPWEKKEIDLMLKRWPPYGFGAMQFRNLYQAYKPIIEERYAIPERYAEVDDTRGSEIYEMWKANDIEKAKLYVEFDVWRVDVFVKMWVGYFF